VFAHNASRYQSDDARCAGFLQSAKRCLPTREFQERPLAPCLLCCLKILQTGDRLIVWKLDRLGRSLHDLITMLDDLRQRGVKFRSLTEAIDTETPTGRAMWQMIRGGRTRTLDHDRAHRRGYAGSEGARRGIRPQAEIDATPG